MADAKAIGLIAGGIVAAVAGYYLFTFGGLNGIVLLMALGLIAWAGALALAGWGIRMLVRGKR